MCMCGLSTLYILKDNGERFNECFPLPFPYVTCIHFHIFTHSYFLGVPFSYPAIFINITLSSCRSLAVFKMMGGSWMEKSTDLDDCVEIGNES